MIRNLDRGIFMHHGETELWINDYLDLYLYAKSIEDYLWQQEIIEKLKTYHKMGKKKIQLNHKPIKKV